MFLLTFHLHFTKIPNATFPPIENFDTPRGAAPRPPTVQIPGARRPDGHGGPFRKLRRAASRSLLHAAAAPAPIEDGCAHTTTSGGQHADAQAGGKQQIVRDRFHPCGKSRNKGQASVCP